MFTVIQKILKYSGVFKSAGISDETEQKQYSKVVFYTGILFLIGVLIFWII